jgi:SAM-dependent methyltransferase
MLSQDEWFEKVCLSYSHPPVAVGGMQLPGFPPDQIQINTTGAAGPGTLKEAFVFYQDCVQTFQSLETPLRQDSRLLDFGVGWGRIARFFLRDIPLQNIHGLDVTEEFIAMCKCTFASENFHVTAPYPPTSLAAETFNFVVGYSVFSHLSEHACKQWMSEFHRLLVPGGVVALTTRGRPFLEYCASLKGQGHTGYLDALSRIFGDFAEAGNRYDRGDFVHSNTEGVTGGGAMHANFYGETFIPEAYARAAYSELFTLERFVFDSPRQTHPIMFFRKK